MIESFLRREISGMQRMVGVWLDHESVWAIVSKVIIN